jgi:hypothetical protein
MIELLKSKKFKLPTLYFISDRKEIKEIPIGVPFIYSSEEDKEYIIRLLEYEILYQRAIATGLPFNFKRILEDEGYDIEDLYFSNPPYLEYKTQEYSDEELEDYEFDSKSSIKSSLFKTFIKDSSAYVDIQILKELKVFPVWFTESIEKAVSTNIHNFAIFNPNMYNKKLEGMYGGLEFTPPNKNLIVIDISGSIPKAVSSTILILSKWMAETFYCDILITGSKSTLYPYETIHLLNIQTIYDENEMDNDQVWFKKLVSEEEKTYKTAIVFGDNHSPCQAWCNKYNKGSRIISREDGKKLCRWKIEKLISFHTQGTDNLAGYSDWFTVEQEERIDKWVKYLN